MAVPGAGAGANMAVPGAGAGANVAVPGAGAGANVAVPMGGAGPASAGNGGPATAAVFGVGGPAVAPGVGVGLPNLSGEPTANPLAPVYGAYVLSQVLGNQGAAGGSSNSNSTSSSTGNATNPSPNPNSTSSASTGSMASPSTSTTGAHGTATNPVAGSSAVTGVGLPNVQSGILDGTPSIHAPLSVGSIAPPPLDLQNSGTTLPPVQAATVVRQGVATAAGVSASGTVAPAALPEPSTLVIFVVASALYLGNNYQVRKRRAAGDC